MNTAGSPRRTRLLLGRILVGLSAVCGALLAAAPATAAPATWRVTPSASRPGINELNGVSCHGPAFCVAAGDYFGAPREGTNIEMWDGRRWSVVPSPSRGTPTNRGTLTSVSCPSTTFCAAVGYYSANYYADLTLIETWNGKRWSISPSPNPSSYSHLLGVSCTSSSDCQAVGEYVHDCTAHSGGSSGFVERWDGRHWSVIPSAGKCGDTELQSVSCSAASRCTAVGYYFHGPGDWTLAESWDGTRWSTVPSPNAKLNNNNDLDGVSCTGTKSCLAVGWYQRTYAGPALTLAETWNGTKWSVMASPSPGTPKLSDSLNGVDCAGPADCVAAGEQDVQQGGLARTLVEAWDGSGWTRTTSPNPFPSAALSGVTCTSRSSCQAVGDGGSSTDAPHRTLIETGSG